jgi:uncharacterized protein (TIGR03435 family)
MRFLPAALLLFSAAASAQTPQRKPAFEAASIKMVAARGGGGHSHENDSPGLLRASMTLKSYIMAAYDMRPFQVTGGPEWVDDATYEIIAKLENAGDERLPPNLTERQRGEVRDQWLHEALQGLLAERFQLQFHHETRQMPAYALTVARSGFKLEESPSAVHCGTNSKGDRTSQRLTAACIDMNAFASLLARLMGTPVANLTRIDGLYDFTLEWTPDELKSAAAADDLALPSIFSALQNSLGLKLESQKAPVDIIVVDAAERPGEN